jgi:uncharacterized protein (TIGR02757 family)
VKRISTPAKRTNLPQPTRDEEGARTLAPSKSRNTVAKKNATTKKPTTSKASEKPSNTPLKLRAPAEWLALLPVMDALVAQYKTPAYVTNDPIQLPYQYVDDPRACELVAFVTALFSYGRRDLIIETMKQVFRIVGPRPVQFLAQYDAKRDAKLFQHFIYRFNKGPDLAFLWERLQWAYDAHGSLEALFQHGLQTVAIANNGATEGSQLKLGIAAFIDQLLGANSTPQSYGLKFLFAHPDKGGACKRFNMFLRWMVRHDPEPSGRVDFGLWKTALQPLDLLVPLDTHILKMNRHLGLTHRTDGSWQTAEAVTDIFRQLCPEDPVKYDYALFGFSLDKRSPDEILKAFRP